VNFGRGNARERGANDQGRESKTVAHDPNTLTRRDLAPMFGPRSVSIGSRALGGSSTDDHAARFDPPSVPGGHRAPRTAHLAGVVPARRCHARPGPGPLPRPGPVRLAAGRTAEPGAPQFLPLRSGPAPTAYKIGAGD